jgi:hypothetical protein
MQENDQLLGRWWRGLWQPAAARDHATTYPGERRRRNGPSDMVFYLYFRAITWQSPIQVRYTIHNQEEYIKYESVY